MQSDAAARQFGVLNIPFASNNQRVEILYVRVRKPNGTLIDTPPADALEMPAEVTRQAPFYSDLKQKQIPVRNLALGDRLEYNLRIVTTRAETPAQFWDQDTFGSGSVVLEESLELHVPADKYVQVWSPKHTPIVTQAGPEKIYRWTSSQLTPITGPPGEAARKAAPPAPEEGELAAIQWTTFKSWQDVGAWYRTLEADRALPDADVKAKVAELIAGKTTDQQKREAIYTYVATQIRYIGVAFGVGRYQPHPAGEILRNQYGDCKDKHTLLAAMFAAAGIPSDAALIGAGIPMNPDVPSPSAFNHLITAVPEAGKIVWLDSTAEVAPYGMLIFPIRDKRALLVPDHNAAMIERTPARLPFPAFQTFEAIGSLDPEGTVTSHMTYTMRGDAEVMTWIALRQVSPGQWEQFGQAFSQGLGFAGPPQTGHRSREARRPQRSPEPPHPARRPRPRRKLRVHGPAQRSPRSRRPG